MNNVQKIIKEICEKKNIDFKLVSKDWIMVLKKDDKIRYIIGYKFPLNNQTIGKICDDKYALYEVANNFNIPVAEHYIVFKNYDRNSIIDHCQKYNFDVVVKKNTGTCGNDMYHTTELDDICIKLDELLTKNYSVSISPYYDIKAEYRTIMLNGEAKLVYEKRKPTVVGDGQSTIHELLCSFNNKYFSFIKPNNDLQKVLKAGETYEYNWQFNLSKGAMPFVLNDKIKENIIVDMAKQVANILGLKFASVDIIELQDGSMLLLEVNSGVMMDNLSINLENGKELAKTIYAEAIDEMFNQ